ncbi:MAG: hypothetical protein K2X55_04820 [Burkholderiaceae bacterium]|nr:hypothetical protein [Burkholderiaceae bacterium]
MTSAMTLRRVVETLPRFAYRFADEVNLHEGMATVLEDHGIAYQREVVAGLRDRFDFLVEGGIVIEAKIKGSLSKALDQVKRYAARADVTAVVLVTTRFWGASQPQALQLHGKPVHVIKLQGASF